MVTLVRRSRVVTNVRRSSMVTSVRRSRVHGYMLKNKSPGYNKETHGEWLNIDPPPDVDVEASLVFFWL